MCDQQRLRPACAYAQSNQSLCEWLEYSMSVKLLTEYNLEFLSLKGDYTGSSGSSLVKMPHCWKSHVTAQMWKCQTRENCCCKPLKTLLLVIIRLLAHLSQRLWGAYRTGLQLASMRLPMRPSVHTFKHIYLRHQKFECYQISSGASMG